MINSGAWSSKGVRPLNEDSFFLGIYQGSGPEESRAAYSGKAGGAGRFFFVADGMGGHAAGDAASAFVAGKLAATASEYAALDAPALEVTVKQVHSGLLAFGARRGTPNMGSTLAGILVQGAGHPSAFFNVGDSRVYRLRKGFLRQLSHDDSLANLIPGGAPNIITNAMGAGIKEITVQSRFAPSLAAAGDIFFMCSDGVHGALSDGELETSLKASDDPESIARRIVEKAIANNSDDNCTAVVVKLAEEFIVE